MEEKRTHNMGFANIGAGRCNFIFSKMAAVVRAGQASVGICC